MNREYYIEKLESLEAIEEYAKNTEQNIICNELIAFLNSELTTDEDIIRESKSETKRGFLLRSILNKNDIAIIKAWEDAEEMPEALKAVIGKNIKKLDRSRINAILEKLVVETSRPAIVEIINKIKNNEYLDGTDIDKLYNAVISSKKFGVRDVEAVLLLVDGINRGDQVVIDTKKEKVHNNGLPENSIEVQNEIRKRLPELFERYNFTWNIYITIDNYYVDTTNDEVLKAVKKHFPSGHSTGYIKGKPETPQESRYEEYISYIAKYGNLESIETMLKYLNDKRMLSKICFGGEILAKTLVHTKPKEIDELIDIVKNQMSSRSEIEAINFILKSPTLLFKSTPAIGTKHIYNPGDSRESTTLSGSMATFMDTMELLIRHGIVIDLARKGSSLIGTSTEKVRRNLDTLLLYKVPLVKEDSVTFYGSTNPGKLLDLAIESDSFEYVTRNPSRLIPGNYGEKYDKTGIIPNDALPYILKYYKERIDGENYKELWNSPSRRLNNKKLLLLCPFDSIDAIFEAYGKVKVKFDTNLEETFDTIIAVEDNNELYDFRMDSYIRDFDDKFRCEDDILKYKFGDVIISRYKFLRYYNTLINKYYKENAESIKMVYDEDEIKKDIMLYALTKDSMLDEKELSTIVKCIENYELAKGKNR